jgi:hypothetical protein
VSSLDSACLRAGVLQAPERERSRDVQHTCGDESKPLTTRQDTEYVKIITLQVPTFVLEMREVKQVSVFI